MDVNVRGFIGKALDTWLKEEPYLDLRKYEINIQLWFKKY